jgi:hypothetical protein
MPGSSIRSLNPALLQAFRTSFYLPDRVGSTPCRTGHPEEMVEFSERVRPADAREALTAFFERRPLHVNIGETS